ncbi:MAG: response regulator [Hyphomonadaceae bacterium]|nr:response regulator [Hyphomonadaceae bacterium]
MTKFLPRQWSSLIVEPERAKAALIQDLLRNLDCSEVIVVREPESALAFLESRAPLVVMCAGRMAPMDGFEFTRKLRHATNVRDCEVSVVLTFVAPERNEVVSALNAGADALLPFPMSANQMRQMLYALATQKRPFVRSATYVGPCRRRGLVQGSGVVRRLEDFGAVEAREALMEVLRTVYNAAIRGGASPDWVEHAAQKLAVYLTEARGGSKIDETALAAQCQALIGQFVVYAPSQSTFDHAFAPLRRLLTTVVAKSLQNAEKAAEKSQAA